MAQFRIFIDDKVSEWDVYSFWEFLAENRQEDSQRSTGVVRYLTKHRTQEQTTQEDRKSSLG
jgi:hypothetical protein